MKDNLNVWGEYRKIITFPVPIKKEHDNGKSITYKIKFVHSFRFMSSSLSNLADNLSEGLQNDNCTDCKSCLDYTIFKDNQMILGVLSVKGIIKKTLIKN